jgi:hypothetical protein
MKNLRFTSRETDEKALIALLCAGVAACVGFGLPLPEDADTYVRLFDAMLCSVFAITAWSAYHLLPHEFSARQTVIAVIAAILLWSALVVGLMILLRSAHFDQTVIWA